MADGEDRGLRSDSDSGRTAVITQSNAAVAAAMKVSDKA